MAKRKAPPIITIVGGGSPHWSPGLLSDILYLDALDGAEIRLFDLDLAAAKKIKTLMDKVAKERSRKTRFIATRDEEKAYRGTQYIIITINTGGLEATRNDIEIPEKYGILQTVGDTVGPGGWNRAIRNIPVFMHIAEAARKWSDDAVVINYSNPMALLTQTLFENCDLRVTGLCHGILGAMDLFAMLFGADKSKVKVTFAGTNHFWFVTDARVEGKPAYPMLKELLGRDTLADYIRKQQVKGFELHRDMDVISDLYHQYGYIAYPAHRHVCEFVSGYINAGPERMKDMHIVRTSTDERVEAQKQRAAKIDKWISGEWDFDMGRSGETAADIIEAVHTDSNFVDDFNLLNRGQIPNLPRGVVVETLGFVNTLGFTPGTHGPMPAPLVALTMPHCVAQKLIMKAVVTGDKEAAYQALSLDPLCSHLTVSQKHRMFGDLMRANRPWLPKSLK
jgi:alpha-galactosidase/6-phospho-beta-glucosidase family protein